MAISAALKTFLTTQRIRYTTKSHKTAYTAQEIAASQHVPGRHLAKCVLISTDKGFFLAVLPAIYRVDFAKLKTLLKAKKVRLAKEGDIKQVCPDVEVGAMSVFGNLYQLPTVVDKSLAESSEIVCNAGTHTDTITVRYQDFARAASPKVGAFGIAFPGPKPAKKSTSSKRAAISKPKKSSRARPPTSRRRK